MKAGALTTPSFRYEVGTSRTRMSESTSIREEQILPTGSRSIYSKVCVILSRCQVVFSADAVRRGAQTASHPLSYPRVGSGYLAARCVSLALKSRKLSTQKCV